MKIITENLKKLNSVWNQVKDNSKMEYYYVYLDFNNEKIKFMNDRISVSYNLTLVDKEEKNSMLIDGNKFFALVSAYSYLEVKGEIFYSPTNDSFKIPILDNSIFEFPDSKINDWSIEKLNFDENMHNLLTSAISYVDKDLSSNFSTLFFTDNMAISLDSVKMFFAKINISNDFNLPLSLLKLLIALGVKNELEIKLKKAQNNAEIIEFEYENILIRYYASYEYELPVNPTDEKFVSSFDHQTHFIIDTSKLAEAILFFSNFFKDVVNPVCRCKFDTASKNMILSIFNKSNANVGSVEYNVPAEFSDTEYFNNKEVYLYLDVFKTVINIFEKYKYDKTLIKYKEGAPAVYFGNSDDNRIFLVHSVIKKE